MSPLQQAIHCYQLPERDQALRQILSNEENRKIVELWIKNHPATISFSPMLKDLRHRIQPASSSQETSFMIENKILSGHFDEDFIDLIKTHLELKTLTISDVEKNLPLLLDHASTQDIAAILKAAETPLSNFPPLSNTQMIRLSAILVAKDVPKTPDDRLPPYIKKFIEIYQTKRSIVDFKRLDLTAEEKNVAIANFIERNRLAILKVKYDLQDDELLELAPYLRYVDLRAFKKIELGQKLLKNCPNLNALFIDSGQFLDRIRVLPLCQEFICPGTVLTELPELPRCQKLDCSKSKMLRVLPALPMCRILDCHGCGFLEILPELPLCQELSCHDCSHLIALPDLPLCQKLSCHNCSVLGTLPSALPLCQKLDCSSCGDLIMLPELPLCQTLDCYYNYRLATLPALPLCTKLDCYKCESLTTLPALPNCKKIDCTNCPRLTELQALPVCEILVCNDCVSLSALPPLPRCQRLYCGHTSLTTLPPLPNCHTLHCNSCALTEFPEIPYNAHVVTVDNSPSFATIPLPLSLPFTSLHIHIEKFISAPVHLLLQLGDHLLINKPFPNIYYFEKGALNRAIDIGGVRRDFVTKLCLTLFKENGLKLEDNFPIAASDQDERAYRTLGCIFAQCYPEKSFYKTGPLFDPGVYQCMLIPNPGSIEWYLTNYLTLINAHEAVRQMLCTSQNAPQLDEEDLTQAAYLAEPEGLDLSKYDRSFFDDPKNRAAVRNEIIKRAKQDPRLKAISWMAQELRKRVPEIELNLQERIEGILNKAALKRKLTWEFTSSQFAGTQAYLMNWIDNHEKILEKFVYAVTGTRAICANDILIQVFDRDKNFIPIAHTCTFTLELSGNYESQEVFDQKIGYFLENALTSSGFTDV